MNENLSQRNSARIDPTQSLAMLYGLTEEPLQVAVLDESFSGLGLAIPLHIGSCEALNCGHEIVVEYADVKGRMEIRHLSQLPSGCRIGAEWTAEALSRSLRAVFVSKPRWNDHSMARILPSGLSKMWKLYEAGNWVRLVDTAEKLRRESVIHKLLNLNTVIDEFIAAVETATGNTDDVEGTTYGVEIALNQFILGCIDALDLNFTKSETEPETELAVT